MTEKGPIRRARSAKDRTKGKLTEKSPFCCYCAGTDEDNKQGEIEKLLTCCKCGTSCHPTCAQIPFHVAQVAYEYEWECINCKACMMCQEIGQEDLLIFCDGCDRACHTFCHDPPFRHVPKGSWWCQVCKTTGRPFHSKKKSDTASPSKPQQSTPQRTQKPIASTHCTPTQKSMELSVTLDSRKRGRPRKSITEESGLLAKEKDVVHAPVVTTVKKSQSKKTKIETPTKKKSGNILKLKIVDKSLKTEKDRWFGLLDKEQGDIDPYCPDENDQDLFDAAKEECKSTLPLQEAIVPSIETDFTPDIPKISTIRFGCWDIDTWYSAPYPEEYNQPMLYLCEYCLKYMKSAYCLDRHKGKCPLRHPPGDEIYRDGILSIFEVDGRKNKIYCQNLCLLAKMFLDHKTLYYDVEPFLFYIMTEKDDHGYHFVGYFSKEKRSSTNYNLSCIVTLPIHQRKGYGQFLIDFSYLLSQKEAKPGSPEKPLSDLGLLSYRNYWRRVMIEYLAKHKNKTVSIKDIVDETCLTMNDVVSTLRLMDMLIKNEHGDYVIRVNMKLLQEYLDKMNAKKYPKIQPDLLRWKPFLLKGLQDTPSEGEEE